MKRRYLFTISVEYTDDVKPSSAAPAGANLRTQSEAIETLFAAEIAHGVPRNVSRSNVRVHVMASELSES